MSSGMVVVMVLMMVVMMGIIGTGVWGFGRRRSQRTEQRGEGEEALGVLRNRYPRGEVSSEEYEERRRMLEGSSGDHGG